jgi:hypothetical protein
MSTSFEVSGGPHLLKGELYHANIHEVTDPTVPTNIIRIDQDWFIHLKWRLSGSLVRMIDGEWVIQTFLESIGPGDEFELNKPGKTLDVNPGSPDYEFKFEVTKGAVPANSYKLVTTIKYRAPDGLPGPMTGFYEVPLVEFYDPGPIGP